MQPKVFEVTEINRMPFAEGIYVSWAAIYAVCPNCKYRLVVNRYDIYKIDPERTGAIDLLCECGHITKLTITYSKTVKNYAACPKTHGQPEITEAIYRSNAENESQ